MFGIPITRCRLVLASCFVAVFGCSTCSLPDEKSSKRDETIGSNEKPGLLSICRLFESPNPYDRTVVELKTTLYRTAPVTSLGDEDCIQPHPPFDVRFSEGLESRICSKNADDQYERICSLIEATNRELENGNYGIDARFVGYFEFCESGCFSRRTKFRLTVQEIRDIERVEPIESWKVE